MPAIFLRQTIACLAGLLLVMLICPAAVAAEPPQRHVLIVCGHPGDDEHREMYAAAIEKLYEALPTRPGFDAGRIHVLFGTEPAEDDGPALQAAGLATRENLTAQLAALQSGVPAAEGLWVIVMGHAHYDGTHCWLNLPGPDIHETEFAQMLADTNAGEQVVFLTTPASHEFLKPLAREKRIVITASGTTYNANGTLFPVVLADVLATPPGDAYDADHDGRHTLFDLYIAVSREIARRYLQEELVITERARLDGNGDGLGREVQIDYLTPEQGGRAPASGEPPEISSDVDSAGARLIELPPPAVSSESDEAE